MARVPFNFSDLEQDCEISIGHYRLDTRCLGARVQVPAELYGVYPYNGSAYGFLQQLQPAIYELGVIEFPDLPLNKTNFTLAQRAPTEHTYSSNPFLTDRCQQPHQDTPPLPTAFWLDTARRYFATWLLTAAGLRDFATYTASNPHFDLETVHRELVPRSLEAGTGLLLNQTPGLLLIDNSAHQALYHARTCNFSALQQAPTQLIDSPMYAFNEIGLLNYIDQLDSRRGNEGRDVRDLQEVQAFLAHRRGQR
jgi:hypothetical protein